MEAAEQVIKARAMATAAHANKVRKFGPDKGKPYIIHPERVQNKAASIAKDYYYNAKIACMVASVAWVHDVPEDHSDDGYDIMRVTDGLEFTDWQYWALKYVTKHTDPESNWKEPYDEFILRLVRGLDFASTLDERLGAYAGAIVKWADLDDNAATATGSMRDKYMLAKYIIEDKFKLFV